MWYAKAFYEDVCKVMNRVIRFLRRKKMDISVDSIASSTSNRSKWYDIWIKRKSGRRKWMQKKEIALKSLSLQY